MPYPHGPEYCQLSKDFYDILGSMGIVGTSDIPTNNLGLLRGVLVNNVCDILGYC